MHEDDGAMAWQHNVWLARQVFPVQAKSVAHGVEEAPDDDLRAGALGPDGLHDPPPLFGFPSVH